MRRDANSRSKPVISHEQMKQKRHRMRWRFWVIAILTKFCIAIHRKFQTRRVAEDSTLLYGEATQHSMRLSVDGYTRRVAEDSTRLYGEAAQRRTGLCEDCYTFQANASAMSASSGGTAWTRAGRRLSGAVV